MIHIYAGPPRSGKSHDATIQLVKLLREGKKVYSNINGLDIDKICLVYPEIEKSNYVHVDYEFYKNLEMKNIIEQVTFIVDECHEIWSSIDRSSFKKDELDYFAKHGHYGHNFILITQDVSSIPKQLKVRSEYIFKYKKLSFLPMMKDRYEVCTYLSDGTYLSSQKRKYNKEIFTFYRSFIVQNDEKPNVKNPLKFFLIVFFLVFIFWAFNMYKSVKAHTKNKDNVSSKDFVQSYNNYVDNSFSFNDKSDLFNISYAYTLDNNIFVNYCVSGSCSVVSIEFIKFKYDLDVIKNGFIYVLYNSDKSIVLEVSTYVPKTRNVGSVKSNNSRLFSRRKN